MAAWRCVWLATHRQNRIEIFTLFQSRNISSSKLGLTSVAISQTLNKGKNRIYSKLTNWLNQYEDFVGLTEVKAAQDRVVEAQRKFSETQELRRERQQQIQKLQFELKEIHAELDKTSRGEDRYLKLITQEHATIKKEKQLLEEFQHFEKAEREYFSLLSNSVRESHEKERSHAERTKYWSIIGSVCGAAIGIFGTTINNWLRMKEIRNLVTESSSSDKLHGLVTDLSDIAKNQHNQLALFITDLKTLLGKEDSGAVKHNLFESGPGKAVSGVAPTVSSDKLEAQTEEILTLVKKQQIQLATEIGEIKGLLAGHQTTLEGLDNVNAVYIGRDVEQLMKESEQKLEWRMKINALATVATIYGALAITIPLFFKAFGGA